MQAAVMDGDASHLEPTASTSGADAATVLCYLDPAFDGRQPAACPTMYFRDMTATIKDLQVETPKRQCLRNQRDDTWVD